MTGSDSSTFTRTNARHIASKVAADLRQMSTFHDKPSLSSIDDYVEELVVLLVRGWLDTVEYGFRRDGGWILSLRYEVRADGTIADGGAGRVPARADLTGTAWYSYLTHTSAYHAAPDRDTVSGALAIQRSAASEPGHADGYWETGKSYSSGGVGAVRKVWRPQ